MGRAKGLVPWLSPTVGQLQEMLFFLFLAAVGSTTAMTFAGVLAFAALVPGLATALPLARIHPFAGVRTRFLLGAGLSRHYTRLRDTVVRRSKSGGGLETRGTSAHETGNRGAGKQRLCGV